MIKLIKRISDKKYLKSVENDIWVDDIKEAYEMSYKECETVKSELLNTYSIDQLKEVVNMGKYKSISKEEKIELINIIKMPKQGGMPSPQMKKYYKAYGGQNLPAGKNLTRPIMSKYLEEHLWDKYK